MRVDWLCVSVDLDTYYGIEMTKRLAEAVDGNLTIYVNGKILVEYSSNLKFLIKCDTQLHGFNHNQLAGHPWNIQNWEISQAIDVYRGFFGKDPLGWRSPHLSFDDTTLRILALHNFKWDSSYKQSPITWLRRLQSPIKLIPIDTRTLEKPHGTLLIHGWEINEETIKTVQSLRNRLVTHSQLVAHSPKSLRRILRRA